MPNETTNLPSVSYYTPVELVGIYRSFLERGRSNGVIWLRGIYVPKQQGQGWSSCYDELKDVNTNVTVTIKLNQQDRQKLKPRSLIHVGGLIELNPFTNGTIQILVNVTRIEIVKDQFVTEQDTKRSEIRIAKSRMLMPFWRINCSGTRDQKWLLFSQPLPLRWQISMQGLMQPQ